MSLSAVNRLDHQTLLDARIAVFVDRQATLDEFAGNYSLAELKETQVTIWEQIRHEIETLPEAAFDRQPDDVDGNDVWSAGQVVSHLCDTEIRSQRFWEQLFNRETEEPMLALLDFNGVRPLSRDETLLALDLLDEPNAQLIDRVDEATDLSRTAIHEVFGRAALKGALLITAIHLDDHLNQLQELRTAHVKDIQ